MGINLFINFFRASLSNAVIELWSHKFRSALSIIGITIALTAFSIMQSISAGYENLMAEVIGEIGGLNKIAIRAQGPVKDEDRLHFTRSRGLRYSEMDSLIKKVAGISGIRKNNHRGEVYIHYMGESYRVCIFGVNDVAMAKYTVVHGRGFSSSDYENGAGVCMLVKPLWQRIRQNHNLRPEDLIGKRVQMDCGIMPVVIGVMDKLVYNPFFAHDNGVFMPFKYYEKYITGPDPQQNYVILKVADMRKKDEIQEEIEDYLIASHRGVRDFNFMPQEEMFPYKKIMDNMNFIFTLIVFLALLVGGLNIMNMMLVSISTRIREIGLRNALGATRYHIFLQFMVEAGFISCMGGLIGIALGVLPVVLFGEGMKMAFNGLKPVIEREMLIYGISISIGVGFVFGLYPAIKALRFNPVTALQYE